MDPTTQRHVDDFARAQHGLVTYAQLAQAGISRSTVWRWSQAGLIAPVGSKTYRLNSIAATKEMCILAACLDHGGVASHRTAAWLHGLLPWPGVIDIMIAKGTLGTSSSTVGVQTEGTVVRHRHSRQTREGPGSTLDHPSAVPVQVHASTSIPSDDLVEVNGLSLTNVARTALGLAALVPEQLSRATVAEAVASAVDRGLATDGWLWWMLDRRRCRGRNGVLVLESVLAERSELGPTESWLEREFIRVVDSAGLRRPKTQRVIRREGRFAARVDFLYEEERVVAEALGYAFHRTPQQMDADVQRANELQLLGHTVLQFTARRIVDAPESVVATVRQALGAASARAA